MGKVVILGATGSIGVYTALTLKNEGYDVIAVGHRKVIMTFLEIMIFHILLLILK